MHFNRPSRYITVLFALVSLLFMQWAVAGYVCPGEPVKRESAATPVMAKTIATATAQTLMPCAESMQMMMDDAQPSLCQAHCHADSQAAYKYQLPAFLAVDAMPSAPALQVAVLPVADQAMQAPKLRRATTPPLAIRNCCFRL